MPSQISVDHNHVTHNGSCKDIPMTPDAKKEEQYAVRPMVHPSPVTPSVRETRKFGRQESLEPDRSRSYLTNRYGVMGLTNTCFFS